MYLYTVKSTLSNHWLSSAGSTWQLILQHKSTSQNLSSLQKACSLLQNVV